MALGLNPPSWPVIAAHHPLLPSYLGQPASVHAPPPLLGWSGRSAHLWHELAPIPLPSFTDERDLRVIFISYLETVTQIPRRLCRLPPSPRARRYRLTLAKRIRTKGAMDP
jgi:hypothetical protein